MSLCFFVFLTSWDLVGNKFHSDISLVFVSVCLIYQRNAQRLVSTDHRGNTEFRCFVSNVTSAQIISKYLMFPSGQTAHVQLREHMIHQDV